MCFSRYLIWPREARWRPLKYLSSLQDSPSVMGIPVVVRHDFLENTQIQNKEFVQQTKFPHWTEKLFWWFLRLLEFREIKELNSFEVNKKTSSPC